MPSTREERIDCERAGLGLYGADGEPSGEPAAPPPGPSRSARDLSEEQLETAIADVRLRRALTGLDEQQRLALADGLLEQLGGEHGQLPDAVTDRVIDGLIAGKRGEAEILGPDGVLGDLTRRLIERALGEELSEQLGYPAGQAPPGGVGNSRNGGSPKTVLTANGAVAIQGPRDRKGQFEPQIVRKGQRRLAGLDEKIIALYAGGMTTREIETYISDLYGPGVSRETVSRVTASVLEDAKAWQTRPLEQIYPILYLDALIIKIRDGQAVRNFACYLAIGVNLDGDRDVLGIWFQKTEGAKFWLQGPHRAQNPRRVRRAGLLRGRPHRVPRGDRGRLPGHLDPDLPGPRCPRALRFVPYKDKRAVAHDLKRIYTAVDRDHAETELERFAETWDPKYPMISASWIENWERIVPFLSFPPDVRRAVYMTNTIEALNRQIRKIIKTRGSFPDEDSARKLHYLAITRAQRKWRHTDNWSSALAAFRIHFGDRVPDTAI